MFPPPWFFCTLITKKQEMGVLTRGKKKEKGALTRSKEQETRQSAFLKVVHPRGYVEIFLKPITAGEIMRRYPRHFVARPDFFDYPWIVVRPESVLVPGKVFFLVSHKTVDKTLKEKTQQIESMGTKQSYNQKVALKDQKDHRYYSRQTNDRHHRRHNEEYYCNGREEQDSDNGSFYKTSFYQSWKEMQRNLDQDSYDYLLGLEPDSPLELQGVKSCLKKTNRGRRRSNLKVSFGPPVIIPRSWSGSPSIQQDDLVLQV